MTRGFDFPAELIENRHSFDMDIVAARDIGSRAWNLDSPSSDRDALAIYREPIENYVDGSWHDSRETTVEAADYDGDVELEVKLWNVRKFGELYADSNPTAIEFLVSDLDYYTNDELPLIEDELMLAEETARQNFNPIGLYYHYRSMAEHNYEKYVSRESKPESTTQTAKKNLYVARSIIYAKYVRENEVLPDYEFVRFVNNNDAKLDEETLDTVIELCIDKTTGNGDTEVGNVVEELYERELGYEPSVEDFVNGGRNIGDGCGKSFVRQVVMR